MDAAFSKYVIAGPINWLVVIGMLVVMVRCTEKSDSLTAESEHFRIHATTLASTQAEMEMVLDSAEVIWGRIAAFLGPTYKPDYKVDIWLEGDVREDGPYVDLEGIHMQRYPDPEGGYLALLAHEMVHAYKIPWFFTVNTAGWTTYQFFDEAIAEYVAQEVDPGKQGYPFYGYPEHIVAGSIVDQGHHIPFDVMRRQHAQVNLRCGIQTYTTRASWMRFVHKTYGDSVFFTLVYPSSEPDNALMLGLTGRTLDDIDSLWRDWILGEYHSHAGVLSVADGYWEQVAWYDVCVEGEDY